MHKYTLENNGWKRVKYHMEQQKEKWYWNEDNVPMEHDLQPEKELNFD